MAAGERFVWASSAPRDRSTLCNEAHQGMSGGMMATAEGKILAITVFAAAKRKRMFAERFLSREQISEAERLAQDLKRAMR